MRVISQNGAIDVPYEITAFHSCNGRIRMNMVGDTGRGTEMAEYSTQEKVNKAMKMLRQTYKESNSIYSNYVEGMGTVVSAACVENCIFQFPTDGEVEA